MKRRQSGARPGGATKSKVIHHARFIYEIAFATPEGDLISPLDEGYDAKLAQLQTMCPDIAQKLTEGTLDVGLAPGSWEDRCF